MKKIFAAIMSAFLLFNGTFTPVYAEEESTQPAEETAETTETAEETEPAETEEPFEEEPAAEVTPAEGEPVPGEEKPEEEKPGEPAEPPLTEEETETGEPAPVETEAPLETEAPVETEEPDETESEEMEALESEETETYLFAGTLPIEYHTQQEIIAFQEAHPIHYVKNAYDVLPSEANVTAGKLKAEVLQDGLNALNQIRYVAGLPANVTLDESYNAKTQAAAFVRYANGNIDTDPHHPSRPSGWGAAFDSIYNLGYSGAGESNLSMGRDTLAENVILGWLGDSDSRNIDRLGHRRWILNPGMKKTGFGRVDKFAAMYAFDGFGASGISVWPAPNTPIALFADNSAWSYSSGNGNESINNVKVTLKRLSDGRIWKFSSSSSDGYFNVDNDGYGLKGCVIFRPNDITYSAGDEFDVVITGLAGGNVSYHVSFFNGSGIYVPDTPVTEIEILSNTLNLAPGRTQEVWYSVDPSEATNTDIIWSSDDESVATVNNGFVTGVGAGETDIRLKAADGYGAEASIHVIVQPLASGVTLNLNEFEGDQDTKYVSLRATVEPENAFNKFVRWESSDPEFASITPIPGIDRAVRVRLNHDGPKEAYITAITDDGGFTATCKISIVYKVRAVGINFNSSMMKGTSIHLDPYVSPRNASNPGVSMSVADPEIASLDDNGTLTANSVGETTLTVTSDENPAITASYTIQVYEPEQEYVPVTGFELDCTEVTIGVGETRKLNATVYPENATDKSLTWESENEDAVSVDAEGNITGRRATVRPIEIYVAPHDPYAEGDDLYGICMVTVVDSSIKVTGVKLDRNWMKLVPGGSGTLTATVLPYNAFNREVTWSSDNTAVATVSSSGVVTAKGAGTADITATTKEGGYTAKCTVIVSNPDVPVIGVSLNKTSLSLEKGTLATLTATVTPSDATNKEVTWSSDNTAVATVSSSGKVTAKAAGTARITATTSDGGYTARCTVTVTDSVVPVTGVTLNKTSLSLEKGASDKLTATVKPDNATDKTVTWKSSDTGVVTVSLYGGIVNAVGAGSATITVTTKDGSHTATCTVNVTDDSVVPVTGITLDRTRKVLHKPGESWKLTATVEPENASDKTVIWSSDTPSVATVSQDGTVTAVSYGKAIITAETQDGGLKAECTVGVIEIPEPTPEPDVESISVEPASLTLAPGETGEFKIIVSPSDAKMHTRLIMSDNKEVATAKDTTITAVAPGQTVIKVRVDGHYAEVLVTVVEVPVTGVTLDKTSLSLAKGSSETLTATVAPANATDKDVTWSSSDSTVATVTNGVVKAVGAGNATITATAGDGKFTASCKVNVTIPVERISISSDDLSDVNWMSYIGSEITPRFTVFPENAANKKYTLTSSNEAVAVIEQGIRVRMLSAGTSVITATTEDGGKRTFFTLTVPEFAKTITADRTELTLAPGETASITMAVYPEVFATTPLNENVQSSEDSSIARWESMMTCKGTETGKIRAVGEGTTVLTHTLPGGASVSITVHVVQPASSSIRIVSDSDTIRYGEQRKLNYEFTSESEQEYTAVWKSSNEHILTVDQNGVITGTGEGTAEITVTAGGVSDTKQFTVLFTHAKKIAFEETEHKIVLGEEKPLKVVFTPEDVSDRTVTYTSKDSSVASVNEEGIVTGKKVGTTVIHAKAADGGYEATASVRVYPNEMYVEPIADAVYDGTAHKPEPVVYDGYTILKKGTDYTVSYKNNKNPGTASVIIKMKGSYKGTKTETFTIAKRNLNDDAVTVDPLSVQTTGKKLNPVPAVYLNGKKLKHRKDFTVSYDIRWNHLDGGTYTLTITGKGSFTGSRKVEFTAAEKGGETAMSKLKVTAKTVKYDTFLEAGYSFEENIIPALTVKNGSDIPEYNRDYVVNDVPDCQNVGTCSFIISAKPNTKYAGERRVSVKVTGIPISKVKESGMKQELGYEGYKRMLDPNFLDELYAYQGEYLEPRNPFDPDGGAADFEVVESTYKNNLNAGTASVQIRGIGRFTGTRTLKFRIVPKKENEAKITLLENGYYAKGGAKPAIQVTDRQGNVIDPADYTVKYTGNTKTGSLARVTVTFRRNYAGSKSQYREFRVQPEPLSEAMVVVKDKAVSSKAGGYKSVPVLYDLSGKKLRAGTDYDKNVSYALVTPDGTVTPLDAKAKVSEGSTVRVTVTGKGNYEGTVSADYRILSSGKDISKLSVKAASKEYTGWDITLKPEDLTFKAKNKVQNLTPGTDYVLEHYTNNRKTGTASVTIRGIGEYGGTKTVKFKIVKKNAANYWQILNSLGFAFGF